jgi:hypothetical protein
MLRLCPQPGGGKAYLSTYNRPPLLRTIAPPSSRVVSYNRPPLKPIASSGRFFPVVGTRELWKIAPDFRYAPNRVGRKGNPGSRGEGREATASPGWYCTERRDRKKEALRGELGSAPADNRQAYERRQSARCCWSRGGSRTRRKIDNHRLGCPVANVLLDCFGNRFVELVFRQQAEFTAQIGLSPIFEIYSDERFFWEGTDGPQGLSGANLIVSLRNTGGASSGRPERTRCLSLKTTPVFDFKFACAIGSYCPDNGGMLRLCTFGTGTAPAPSGEVAEQFVPARLKPITFPVSRAPEISAACRA